MPSDTVVRVVADPDYVYAAGPHGLARFNKVIMQWEPMGNFADKLIYDLYSNQAQLWVATDQGVFYFDKKFEKWESYTAANGLISNTAFRVFYFSNYIWIETDKGFSRYSTTMKTWNSYPLNDGIVGSAVNYMLVDASYIWVASPEGVARFNGASQSWENFSRNMPIEKKTVYSISTSGTTEWFTTSDGVYTFDESQRRWKTYTAVDGLSDDMQDEVYTSGQTTLCRKGMTYSYLKTDQDIWYPTTIKVIGGGEKPKWKAHMDETGLGVTAPSGQSVNVLGRAYYDVENKATFPSPLTTSIPNYILNKNLDSVVYAYDTLANGAVKQVGIVDTVATYKDFLYGWAKAQMGLNADLNNGRTFRATYDNTDPLGDLRYGAEYRGFGDDVLRRAGWRTDQKTDYLFSSLIQPTYLEGAGIRTELGDRVGDKKLRRDNTGIWAGFGKTKYFRKLIPFREDNFYELGVQNIVTESVQILVDGQVVDPSDYSLERTMGLLTFKNEDLANPDSRIEVSCQYQPTIGVFTDEMVSAENVVQASDKVALGINGVYRGVKEPSRIGLDSSMNRDFAGSVNSKIEMKSADNTMYLRAIPEVAGSYNDSIVATKEGSAAKIDVYSVIHNFKLKVNGLYQTPDYVTLADQNSVYGRTNHQAGGELVYEAWQQFMPITLGASEIDANQGNELREYAQYLISPQGIPSLRLYALHQVMKNYTQFPRDSVSLGNRDSLSSDRWNFIAETEWGKSFKYFDRLWFDVQYSANILTDTLDTVIGSPNAYTLSQQFNQRLNHNIFAWVRAAPVKKLQLEVKGVLRIHESRPDMDSAFTYRGFLLNPEFKLFSQELIPGVTLYGDYLMQPGDSVVNSEEDISTFSNMLNTSVLLVPGVWVSPLNFFQLNLGYTFSNDDSLSTNLFLSSKPTTLGNTMTQSYTIKPILDFSQDLHFDSRFEKDDASNFSMATDNGFKIYNEANLAFRERRTRFDADLNIFVDKATSPNYSTNMDTLTIKNDQDEFRLMWTERWMPTFRTQTTIDLTWQNVDTTESDPNTGNVLRDTVTGFLNTITPGILFDWRVPGTVIREWRTQYYIGAQLLNGQNYTYNTYSKAMQNKIDIQVKAGANFYLRLLMEVDYLFTTHQLEYNMAELKATALF